MTKLYYTVTEVQNVAEIDALSKLHYWCKAFNIAPKQRVKNSKYRFTDEQVARLVTISKLSKTGFFTSKGIRAILDNKLKVDL